MSLVGIILFINPVFAKEQAAVAMPDSYSADVAVNILNSGGNAVDAAIAAQFVLAVTLPEAGNLGGGGFMAIYQDGKSDFLDYRELAPYAAHRDMYLDKNGEVIENLSLFGILAAGTPGTVDGMWQAHKKYGTLPWKTLLQPAVDLAKNGFIVHPQLADEIKYVSNDYKQNNIKVNFDDYFLAAKAGKVFKQPELAATLTRIRDQGKAGFYQGKTAEIIVGFMQENQGLITHKDLTDYQAKWRTPIQKKWSGYQVITAPPPSSGGIAILQWLTMYELLADPKLEHNSVEYIHLLSEIGKRVFADRAEYLGDPDFIKVPVNELIANNYLVKRSKGIKLNKISSTENIKPGLKESEDTTHFSILDQWGNAVSNTTTINLGFGSGMVVEGAGFLLNDEMDDFSIKPGVPNVFGAVGGQANEIQPKKRMLSSMSPTIILKDGKVTFVTGSPGGTTIITSVYQSILNALVFNMPAQKAVDSPRFHHQLLPINEIKHHQGLTEQQKQALETMGYHLKERNFGDLHLILRNDKGLDAASQSSGRGKSVVIN
ncbi:gamma-glutamyltransferase [Thalassomonas sp. M1454]|uniref:gamma-glutamyltransferase n=1 Tax=Thalassomonas sp. M1454 TaxID=2594477 RepID=UPI0021B108D0|nr:gamma-glutamyltransferase [Thalassomonas sp. M1454]